MKRVLSLLLALAMAFGLLSAAGCTDNSKTSATPTPTPTKTATPTPSGSQPTDEPDDSVIRLPIVDTPVTFNAWMAAAGISVQAGMTTMNDSFAFQEAVKRTNVSVNFTHPTSAGERESFNLLFASGNLPDFIIGGTSYYIGGQDRYIDDGFIIDLTDLVDQYCPNYEKAREISDIVYRSTTSDVNRLCGFWQLYYNIQPSWQGLVYRQDLLDSYNMAPPSTVGEFYDMLTKMKSDVTLAPLFLGPGSGANNNGVSPILLSGFGANPEFMQIDNKVTYGPTLPGFREYVETVSQWYSEGLIDPDFTGRQNAITERGLFTRGEIGVMPITYTFIDVMEQTETTVSGLNIGTLAAPTVNKGDMRRAGTSLVTHRGGQIATITVECKEVETAVRWWDWFYSDEGAQLGNYGVENQGFTYVNGKPMLTELCTKNPDGLGISDAMTLYTMSAWFPRLYSWEREITDAMSQKSKDAGAIWDSNLDIPNMYTMPPVSMTADESGAYSATYGDIKTYVDETVAAFVTGGKPMSEYDAFVNQLWTMGLQKCIDFQQTALDRFNARPGLNG